MKPTVPRGRGRPALGVALRELAGDVIGHIADPALGGVEGT